MIKKLGTEGGRDTQFLSVLLRIRNSSGDLKTSVHVCVDALQCIAPACTVHVWGVWLCPDCQRYTAQAHIQVQQCSQKWECIQPNSNSHGCFYILTQSDRMWAICLDIQILCLFAVLSNWKKDRIIHLPVKSALSLPSHGGLTGDLCPVSKQLPVYLAAGRGQSSTPALPCLPWNEKNAHAGRALILFLLIEWAWLHSVTEDVQLWSGQSSTGYSWVWVFCKIHYF